jgi:tetratricopeptide (TPR) repeat protein
MFNEKDILARLQNGEDAQAIADEFAKVINAANKTYTDQKAAEEAAKAQAKQVEIQKREELQEIIDLFMEWLETFYGIKSKEKISADQVIELVDSLKEYVEAIKDFEKAFGLDINVLGCEKPVAKPTIKKSVQTQSADDTLNAFLNKMGW